MISLCLAGAVSVKRKSQKKLKLIEGFRIILTGLVCMEYLEGRSWISWTILISTPFCIWAYPLDSRERIIGVAFHLLCPLALLSASYEPLFFLTLVGHLLCWPLSKEQKELEDHDKHMSMQDLARAASLVSFSAYFIIIIYIIQILFICIIAYSNKEYYSILSRSNNILCLNILCV